MRKRHLRHAGLTTLVCLVACSDSGAAAASSEPGASARERRVKAGARADVTAASSFCHDVGYLCAGLEQDPAIVLRRWVGHEGTVVVHVPRPDVGDTRTAQALQRAAAQGIRAWNNQPFPVLADVRGDRQAHFAVEWRSSLGGRQLGLTRTAWSSSDGIRVLSLTLAALDPDHGGPADPHQVRLTAAHEMGHALGLPHSDRARDVMYPTNTATSMSAQDYRSIEVLYAMPNGTTVER